MSKVVAGFIGAGIALYAFVYAPMARNYSQCGKVTLCPPGRPNTPSSQDTDQ